jgi:two-component system, cell cycle sensor histidine kinase and response regulator CckA
MRLTDRILIVGGCFIHSTDWESRPGTIPQQSSGWSGEMTRGASRSATLLIVDDEPAILRMLVEALKEPGLTVLTATSGEKAIEIYRQNQDKIDMVLLDLHMHPRSGLQILTELKRINPHVRVAVMSGSPSEGSVTEMLEAGVVSVFPKPFISLSDLSIALNQLVEVGAE